jgi:beta-glucosidase
MRSFEIDGKVARDLNDNGELDPYEDPRVAIEDRITDLLARMTLEEKVGLMFYPSLAVGANGEVLDDAAPGHDARQLIVEHEIRHFNIREIPGDPTALASWHNRLQRLAQGTRLGIPVTIASDPRHAFDENRATGFAAGAMSQWPEPIGFGAIGDPELARRFGEIARAEYRAVGIHVALHPMADIATEPRWGRVAGTFGADIDTVSALTAAYVLGFQGEELGPQSVACMVKHFPGAGPQGNHGEDAHFPYGKDQVYPGGRFADHLHPFRAALDVGVAQVMPYYGRPIGTELEEVGFGFNREVVTGILRERLGFQGVVCTDWRLITDETLPDGSELEARAWGVEHLDTQDRVLAVLEAGCDQFGGEALTDVIVQLVQSGRLESTRIDESTRRLLRDKFRLGLFDDPFVDEEEARLVCGAAEFRRAGYDAQRDAVVVLSDHGALPIPDGAKLYIDGLSPETASAYATVVEDPDTADIAVVYRTAPYEPRSGNFLEGRFRAGSLEYSPSERAEIIALARRVSTVLVVHLDRPAILTELNDECAAIVATFGASPEAILDVLFGRFAPRGRLPFELPASTSSLDEQHPDVGGDTPSPLFRMGHRRPQ